MADGRFESPGTFERIRKVASRIALTVFAASFAVLLVGSATPYWGPENEWLILADQAWKVSGLTALVLGLVPPVRRLFATFGEWIGLSG